MSLTLVLKSCSRGGLSDGGLGAKTGLSCPHIESVSFENVNGIKQRQKM